MRTRLVVANWKMNGSLSANADWAKTFVSLGPTDCEAAVCAPAVYLLQMADCLKGSAVTLGGEDASEFEAGAYTGETSAAMLKDVGCTWVILGHSERRALFGDTDARVAAKTKAALAVGLSPIVCVGETLEEREAGRTIEVVARQTAAVLDAVGVEGFMKCTLAYEPVWAIGTGKSATPEIAQQVHEGLRSELARRSEELAAKVRILYGGSVKPANAAALFAMPDIDGGLIGGAALKAEDFYAICTAR